MEKKQVAILLLACFVLSLACSISDSFFPPTPTPTSTPTPTLTSTPTTDYRSYQGYLSAGWQHTCVVIPDGGVQCWGANEWGQLGDGTTKNRSVPVDVIGLDFQAASVAAGLYHTCALSVDGRVKCWGGNGNGQLGNGTNTNNLSPVEVAGLDAKIVAIDAGASHSCAITQSGGMVCWGFNDSGQLGDGTTVDRNMPVGVTGLSEGVAAIALGKAGHTCAVLSSGGVKCWGWNDNGQVGEGTQDNRSSPVEIGGLANIIDIAGGYSHTCALSEEGKIFCWGANDYGQLGDGTRQESPSPVEIEELPEAVVQISAGSMHTCALTKGGKIFCWGWNDWGQLGDGSNTQHNRPVAVFASRMDILGISAGGYHTCGLTADGEAVCWGGNDSGQLGDGSTGNSNFPVEVLNLGI